MTRWLAAAKTTLPPPDKIDRNDKNTPEQIKSISSEGVAPLSGKRRPEAAAPKPATVAGFKPDLRRDLKLDPVPQPGDPEAYAEALRVHGPMSYGMAMRVLGWGATRAGQAETTLRAAGCITLNNHGRAVLTGAQS